MQIVLRRTAMMMIMMMMMCYCLQMLIVLFGTTSALPPDSLLTTLVDFLKVDSLVYLASERRLLLPRACNSSFPGRQWILTGLLNQTDFAGVFPSATTTTTTTAVRTVLIVLDQADPIWPHLIEVFSTKSTKSLVFWLLSSSEKFDPTIFTGIYIPFDSPFFSVNPMGNLLKITEVYQLDKSSDLIAKHFGYWMDSSGLTATTQLFYRRRNNFHNHQFKAYITNNPPYTSILTLKNGSHIFGGYFYEVWKELEFRLKFRTEFIIAKNDPKRLVSQDVPFIVGPVAQKPQSAALVALSEPIHKSIVYLFGYRPGSELEWNSYLKPFSLELWLTTLGWMLCSSAALTFIYWLGWTHGTSERHSSHYIFTAGTSLITVFRALCSQGSDVTPNSSGCRVLFLSIYMSALVVTSAFSAALFSLLTVPISRAPFNNFDDVLNNKNKYKLTIVPDSDIYEGIKDFAERFPNSHFNGFFKMFEPINNLPKRVDHALEKICNNKDYVLMWDLPNVLEVLQNLTIDCRNKVMPGGPKVFEELIGFGFMRGSPYQELIDLHLVRMKNEGVLSRLSLNAWPPRIPNVINTWVRVTIADISPILYLFTAGAAMGALILLVEHVYTKRKHQPLTQQFKDYYYGAYYNARDPKRIHGGWFIRNNPKKFP